MSAKTNSRSPFDSLRSLRVSAHDKLLLILSEHSMASDWVGTEIANAREREAREIREYYIPDFSR